MRAELTVSALFTCASLLLVGCVSISPNWTQQGKTDEDMHAAYRRCIEQSLRTYGFAGDNFVGGPEGTRYFMGKVMSDCMTTQGYAPRNQEVVDYFARCTHLKWSKTDWPACAEPQP